jgi:hypothetical protein
VSLKRGGAPKTLEVTLTITGQGFTDKLKVVYHNRKRSEVEQRRNELTTANPNASVNDVIAALTPYIVQSWDTDFELTEEGVKAFDDEHEGVIVAIWEGFWNARRKQLEGN